MDKDTLERKREYLEWCGNNYVPVYSKSWWLDAVCGSNNWDVWLYKSGNSILAAMPYYMENRCGYKYITKAPLTQNNGIIFSENIERGLIRQAEFEEKVINEACDYIADLEVDVYEQQYQPSFTNWMPFFWNGYTNTLRYTYVIEDTSDMDKVWNKISSKYRNKIRNGSKKTTVFCDISSMDFYKEHEKVFLRQGQECPFSIRLWKDVYEACKSNHACRIMSSINENGDVCAVLFLVWDERRVYQILGGYMPEYSKSNGYPALIYEGIKLAHKMGKAYDFEGSMIKQISVAFRQFGGVPMPYYRIRKIFSPEIARNEFEAQISNMGGYRSDIITFHIALLEGGRCDETI